MTSTTRRFLGLILLAAAAVLVVGIMLATGNLSGLSGRETITVKGYLGGEKVGFVEDPQIRDILRRRHGIVIDYVKAGSIEFVEANAPGQDFLWPASQFPLELYKERQGRLVKAESVFTSPLVLYSWVEVTDALEKAGLIERLSESTYTADLPRLVQAINDGKRWEELGLPLYGRVTLQTTDPLKSNSGNMFAGLLANILNRGEVADEGSLPAVLPGVKRFFDRLGLLDSSSGDLFDSYLTTGVGAHPIIVAYENQLIEFALEHEDYRQLIRQKVRILYPKPTVWADHPLIALTPNGARLLEALNDPEIQRLAWERHGFRSGLIGTKNDPKVLAVVGLPETVQAVMPLPKASVMTEIMRTLRGVVAQAPRPLLALRLPRTG
jgi:hypothetical protein